jgi:SPP1 gp7 family putative phage head morphogenesis protein
LLADDETTLERFERNRVNDVETLMLEHLLNAKLDWKALLELDNEEIPNKTKPIQDALHKTIWQSYLLGRNHIRKDYNVAFEATKLEFKDIPGFGYNEASDFLKSLAGKIPVTKAEFKKLDAVFRFRAFTAAAMATVDGVNRIKQALLNGLRNGETAADFEQVVNRLGLSTGQRSFYWETVYRNNAISAYNSGRWDEINGIEEVEMVEYIAILDSRTTNICRRLRGTVLPKDDSQWSSITPPNHHNCRSTIRAIFSFEVDKPKVKQPPKNATPSSGFETSILSGYDLKRIPKSLIERARDYGVIDTLADGAKNFGVDFAPDSYDEVGKPSANFAKQVKIAERYIPYNIRRKI